MKRSPETEWGAAKRQRSATGAVRKYEFRRTYQRTSSVRVALGRAVADPLWAKLFRETSSKMTTLSWIARKKKPQAFFFSSPITLVNVG